LQEYVPLRDYKRKVSAPTLWAVLIIAAAEVTSIHAACGRLDGVPCDETIRKALYTCLPDFAELQQQLNRALAGRLPRTLRRRPQRLAIDLTLIPYHGEPFHDPAEVYRGLAKDGTSHFHAYVTAYVILRGQRFTVALTAVAKGEPLKGVVQRLLAQARSVGVKARHLLLDRGFYSVDVIRYLQAARYPFLMPVVVRGRKPDDPRGPSGTRVFSAMKRSGWFSYSITSGLKRTATVSICVSCRNYRGQWQRHGRQALVYACWAVKGHSCTWVRETYRTRFGIESSYRQMNQAGTDVEPPSGASAVVCGDCLGAAQRVGVAPFRGVVVASSGRAADPPRAVADAAALVELGDRRGVRDERPNADRKGAMFGTSDIAGRIEVSGNY
jgi:putative transposase